MVMKTEDKLFSIKLSDVTCLSDIYYVIGSWFTVACFIVALSILPLALTINDSVVSFLMCGGIALVGAAANYKDAFAYEVHYGAALVSMLASVAWILSVEPIGLLTTLLIAAIGVFDRKRWLLWMEIACILSVIESIIVVLCTS